MRHLAKQDMKFKAGSIILLIVMIVLSLIWWALFNPMMDRSTVEKYIQSIQEKPGKALDALPIFPTYQTRSYQGENKRSPFQPALAKSPLKGDVPDLNRPRGELEAFSLDSLRMVGAIQQGSRLWAIIKAPNDLVYRITVGDYMGKDYGKVIKITDSDIVLSESVSDGMGTWVKREAILTLSE